MIRDKVCPCCHGKAVEFIGTKKSVLHANTAREFSYFFCKNCFYRYQSNPNLDYQEIYDESYYQGSGADNLVDYGFELLHPDKTIRHYEFIGILNNVETLVFSGMPNLEQKQQLKWLDFGCGNGAFVNYLNQHTPHTALGFDVGFASQEGKKNGMPILGLEELTSKTFDVITAIEVLEHLVNPLETLELIFKLLKPGGTFFYTTGNSMPFAQNFLNWKYTKATDVHIGFFEPSTLEKLFTQIGFQTLPNTDLNGWGYIYKYKVLKNLRMKKRNLISTFIPNSKFLTRILDKKFKLMAMPAASRPPE